MSSIRFEWDERKNAANRRKHRVGFEDARTVFYDEFALLLDDEGHSTDQDRFILLGRSASARILIVCHCYRSNDEVIRLISARRANAHEQAQYLARGPS